MVTELNKGVNKVNETRTERNAFPNDSIRLWQLIKAMRKHLVMIIVATVFVAAVCFGLAKYAIVPQYTSSSQILVNQKHATADGQAFNNQQADIQMINTYKGIITNHQILNATRVQLADANPGYRLSYKRLKKMVSVQTSQNSQLFEIRAKASSPREATVIANTVTDVFQKRIKKIMGFSNTKVTSRAVVPDKPSFPNVTLFTLGGALIGFFLGTVVAVIKEVG
ncbi:YveK family protein [Limosilactobacillus sp.]|uniref:YveK family protein n=1 Tax=Limosilactobacillus sp. TaxID=2773925 RepID=UPI003EFC1A71